MNRSEFEALGMPRLEKLREEHGGQIFSVPVGVCNEIQGHAIGLDVPKGRKKVRLVMLASAMDSERPAFTGCCSWAPTSVFTMLGFPQELAMDTFYRADGIDHEIRRHGHWIADRLSEKPSRLPRVERTEPDEKPIPDAEYAVFSAALRARFADWPVELLVLDPLVRPFDGKGSPSLLAIDKLDLPFVVKTCPYPDDWIDFYQSHERASGWAWMSRVRYGQNAELRVSHSTGTTPDMFMSFMGLKSAPKADSVWPGNFTECLVMRCDSFGWQLKETRSDIPEPPGEPPDDIEMSLQRELGDRAEVLSVSVEQFFGSSELMGCRIRTGGREYRVGRQRLMEWDGQVFREPMIFVLGDKITGKLILEGIRLYEEGESASPGERTLSDEQKPGER